MKLYIDTTNSEKIKIGLNDKIFEADSKKEKAQMILPFITSILEKQGKNIKDLKEIEVNTGPGSFTGIRVGVSVAQALAWSLGVPLNGKNLDKNEPLDISY